jgi:hypothetical protein
MSYKQLTWIDSFIYRGSPVRLVHRGTRSNSIKNLHGVDTRPIEMEAPAVSVCWSRRLGERCANRYADS